ncbi:exodeoxyribonuclease III [Micrococcales bacterium 31B]|nr:exodeoxyribonuclease III [Micrococcales bacterium 31B]
MRIATWNINSVRARIDRVLGVLQRHDIDVMALQETKCKPEQFPHLELGALGYEVAAWGINQWNGVALISRIGLDEVVTGFAGCPTFKDVLEPRSISASCGGVRVWSLYVPNGREIDDPHYAYKLEWLSALRENVSAWLTEDPTALFTLTGDWNIAPRDHDVWDMAEFAGKTHVTAPERAAFAALLDAGLSDVVRPFTEGESTYWDYQAGRLAKNHGMRIDFHLSSPALARRTVGAFIDREERKGEKTSDHAPVIVDIEI